MNVYVAQCEFGQGVFAARDFAIADYILEYKGSIICSDVAHRDVAGYPLQISENTYIDLYAPGRFTNHSCSPNAGIIKDTKLIAINQIKRNEEIRIDYSTTMWEENWTMQCCCGALSCRKIIKDFYLLPLNLQQHYLRLNIVQNFIVQRLITKVFLPVPNIPAILEQDLRGGAMLQVNASAGISMIHGIGLIAREFIRKGSIIWTFQPGFDQIFTEAEFQALPSSAQVTIQWYAYFDPLRSTYILSSDDDRFTNHSDTPNTQDGESQAANFTYAIRDINEGEEITWNYRAWGGGKFL